MSDLWPTKLLKGLPYPGPTTGWLADVDADWWAQLRLEQFSPQTIPGCVLYLDPSDPDGITLTDATFQNGSTLTGAGWSDNDVTSLVNADGFGGSRFTVSSATAPTLTQTPGSCATHATAMPPLTLAVKYAAGATVPAFCLESRLSGPGAADRTWFLPATNAIGTAGSAHSAASISAPDANGYRTASVTVNSCGGTPTFRIRCCSANGVTTGASVGQLITLKDATVSQTRVASLVNLVSGISWAQGTVNNQLGYLATGLNGRPCVRNYSSQYILSTEAPVLAAMNGSDPAFTVIYAIRYHTVDNIVLSIGDSGSTNHWAYVGASGVGSRAAAQRRDATTTFTAQSGINGLNTDALIQEWYTSSAGTEMSHRRNGAAADPNAATLNAGTVGANQCGLLTWARNTPSAGALASLGSLVMFNRALSDTERSFVRRALAAKYNIAVAA